MSGGWWSYDNARACQDLSEEVMTINIRCALCGAYLTDHDYTEHRCPAMIRSQLYKASAAEAFDAAMLEALERLVSADTVGAVRCRAAGAEKRVATPDTVGMLCQLVVAIADLRRIRERVTAAPEHDAPTPF